MLSRLLVFLLFTIICPDVWSQTQAIVNVTVINVRGEQTSTPSQTVILKNGKIIQLGLSSKLKVPNKAAVIDGTGKFLIPGLWDMHVHLSYYGPQAYPMLVSNGVTSVRDMGGDLNDFTSWLGTSINPDIYHAGPFVDGPKNMDAKRTSFTEVVRTAEDGRKVVAKLNKQGVFFIKIHSRVPREAFFAIAEEAKKVNLDLAVHAPRDVSVEEISNAGARSIEHTESLLGEAIYEDDEKVRDSLTNLAFRKLETSSVFETIRKNGNFYDPTAISIILLKGDDYERKLGPRLLPLVTKLHKAGVPLLTGSDFGVKEAGITPGVDLHGELELFVQAGLTPIEALRSATINAAECLRVSDKTGSIEKGKRADMVLLDANPLIDISNTRRISKVFLHGQVVSK